MSNQNQNDHRDDRPIQSNNTNNGEHTDSQSIPEDNEKTIQAGETPIQTDELSVTKKNDSNSTANEITDEDTKVFANAEQENEGAELKGDRKQLAHTTTDHPTREIVYTKPGFGFAFKVVLITLFFVVLIGGIVVGSVGYYVYANLQPVDPEDDEQIHISIPLGSSPTSIASILYEEGIIKHERLFYLYVRFQDVSGFQAGEYYLSPSMELDEIIDQLQEGLMYADAERFTIPEGYTVEQVAAHLASLDLVDEERFLRLAGQGDFPFAFLNDIPESDARQYKLEGFLFPLTYEVSPSANEEEIITLMLEHFENNIEADWHALLNERDMSFYEAVILASIIEREAAVAHERRTISGVYHNRIAEGMRLQADATVQYALDEYQERVLYEHLEVDDPYNTYVYEGLPPGPIANPGAHSIGAAIDPEEHTYFYYVTKKDGSGEHYFAETYEEHQENIAISEQNAAERAEEEEDNEEDE